MHLNCVIKHHLNVMVSSRGSKAYKVLSTGTLFEDKHNFIEIKRRSMLFEKIEITILKH